MDPVAPGTWARIPGYDGSSDSEEDEEELEIKTTAAERLAQIVEVLGERYVNVPFLDFVAAPPVSKTSYRSAPHPRLWGQHGPPPAFKIEHTDAVMVRETFLSNGLAHTGGHDWIIQWCGPSLREWSYHGLHEYQRVNHFPGSTELTRKDRMYKHLQDKSKVFGKETFDFLPETFVLPEQLEEFLECFESSEQIWIVKPHASSRGRGIFLLRDASELPLDEVSVVSRYIENPLLIQGLKWDLRVYVVVTGFEPLRAYVYREGLTRFASSPYSTDEEHLQDAYRHLTNYSINKSSRNFVENQEAKHDNVGHKWSLSALLKHLQCVGVDVELMWARIHDLILKTLIAVEPTISSKSREIGMHPGNCFEVYGFDVLVDEDLKPWLIEVNLSPSMQAESPLDWQVKSTLLADVFNLVGVSHVDNNIISTSRLRNRILQARDSAPPPKPTLRPRTASGGKKAGDKAYGDRSAADILNAAVQAVEPLLKGVNLDELNERQLKMLAHTLRETGRRHNFIRLYPTKATVRRYAPLMEPRLIPSRFRDFRLPSSPDPGKVVPKLSASQLLASLLFGPAPVRAQQQLARSRSRSNVNPAMRRDRSHVRSPSINAQGRNEATAGSDVTANTDAKEAGTGAVGSTAEAETDSSDAQKEGQGQQGQQASKTGKVLGRKSGQRLLFMEYLVRVSSVCESLGRSEKAKICQTPSYTRLRSFHRQLKQRQNAEEEEDPEAGNDVEALIQPQGAGLIDDLAQLCRSRLEALATEIWETEATNQDPATAPKGLGQKDSSNPTTESFLPPSFAASLLGKKVITGLVCLSANDLERFLAGLQCAAEYRLDLRGEQEAEVTGPSFFHENGQWKEVPRKTTKRPSSSGRGRRPSQQQDRRQMQSGPLHDLLRVPREGMIDPVAMTDHSSTTTAGHCLPNHGSDRPASSPSPGSPHTDRTPAASPPPRTQVSRPTSRPKSASLRGGRPPSGSSSRARETAERASALLARTVSAQTIKSEPLRLPLQPSRSAAALLPDAMAEALTPLRFRSSQSLKMNTSPSPAAAKRMDAQKPVALPRTYDFNMEIEL